MVMTDINQTIYELDTESVCHLLPLNKVFIDYSSSDDSIYVNDKLLVCIEKAYISTTIEHRGPGYLRKILVNINYAKQLGVLKTKQGNK